MEVCQRQVERCVRSSDTGMHAEGPSGSPTDVSIQCSVARSGCQTSLQQGHLCARGWWCTPSRADLGARQLPCSCSYNMGHVSAVERSTQAVQCWVCVWGGSLPGARPEQDIYNTQVELRELRARPSMVSTRPQVAKIIWGSQRVRAGLNLREKTQHQEQECRGAKSNRSLGSIEPSLTTWRLGCLWNVLWLPWWGVPESVGLTLSTVPGCLKSLMKHLNKNFTFSINMSTSEKNK